MNVFNLPDNEMETQMQKRLAELEKANQDLRAENILLNREVTRRKKAEEALQESEKRYRMLHESMRDAFAQVSMDGRIIEFNDLYCKMLGYSPEEMYKLTYQEMTPECWHALEEYIIREQVIPRGYSDIYEKEYQRKDGTTISVELRTILSRDVSGRPNGMWAIVRDITERKKIEEAIKKTHETLEEKVRERTVELEKAYYSLKESEKRLDEAQRMAHIGNWDWDLITGKEYWSDELHRIFKRDPQKDALSYKEYLNYVHPDDRDFVDSAFTGTLNEKTYEIDHRIILANREEHTVHIQAEVVFNDKNIPIQTKGIVQDITERKKAEENIQNLANIVESTTDAVVTVSLENIITSWNKGAEQIFAYTAGEILGKKVSILEPENHRGEIEQLVEKIKQGEKVKYYETSRLKKNGTTIIVSGALFPVFDTSRKLVAISVIVRDISEIKKAEGVMANIEIARKKEIHHRIKNNLQVISSLLDLQAEKFGNREFILTSEVMEAFRESQDRVISMALIHEELYKSEGLATLNFSLYIEELAENLFQTYRLRNANISLNMDMEENIFFDMDYAVPLGIIINELISNSLKHAFPSNDEGEIRIELHREKNGEYEKEKPKSTSFSLTVSDNGVGIPENLDIEDLNSLGLQLVTSLVDQLEGELELKRDNGTEFTIKFIVTEKNNQASVSQQLI